MYKNVYSYKEFSSSDWLNSFKEVLEIKPQGTPKIARMTLRVYKCILYHKNSDFAYS